MLFAQLEQGGDELRQQGLPLIRALRGRSFLLAADLGWVPFFPAGRPGDSPAPRHCQRYGDPCGAAIRGERRASDTQAGCTLPQKERRRRLALVSLRDGMQILLLTLGGALAISGKLQIGEIVAATLLSLRALGAVSAALDDAPALRAALHSWQQVRMRGKIG